MEGRGEGVRGVMDVVRTGEGKGRVSGGVKKSRKSE